MGRSRCDPEYGQKVSASMAETLQTLSSTLQQSAQSAGQRAELARSAWQTLDQLSSSALAELNRIQPGQVEAQVMAPVEN